MAWEKVKVRDLTLNAETVLAQVSKEQQDRVYRAAFRRAMERGAKRVTKADVLAVLKEMTNERLRKSASNTDNVSTRVDASG